MLFRKQHGKGTAWTRSSYIDTVDPNDPSTWTPLRASTVGNVINKKADLGGVIVGPFGKFRETIGTTAWFVPVQGPRCECGRWADMHVQDDGLTYATCTGHHGGVWCRVAWNIWTPWEPVDGGYPPDDEDDWNVTEYEPDPHNAQWLQPQQGPIYGSGVIQGGDCTVTISKSPLPWDDPASDPMGDVKRWADAYRERA